MNKATSSKALTLNEALKLSALGILSPSQGAIVSNTLCIRCFAHINEAQRESALGYHYYDFWTHHQHLFESTNHASTHTLAHLKSRQLMTNASVLYVNIVLQATILCLHEAAITRVNKTKVSSPLVSESETICIDAALEISDLMRYVPQSSHAKVSIPASCETLITEHVIPLASEVYG